jgi:beta-glucosidase
VRVANAGKRAGEEIVQLYLRDECSSVSRPLLELRGFRRVGLAPGEAQTVEFTLGPSELGFTGADMRFGVEPGGFTVMVGGNSRQLLHARFVVIP